MAEILKACRYHPDAPSRWNCPDCNIHFCSRCAPSNDRGEAFCPVCDRMLVKQVFSPDIPPYWKRMPAAFFYPLRPASLLFLGFVSITAPLLIFLGGPVIGGIAAIVILPFILMKYAFQSLQSTAVGHPAPPVSTTSMSGRDFELPVKSYLLIFVSSILLGLLTLLGTVGDVISTVLMALIYPAMMMVLGITRSFFRSLNPAELIGLMRLIGPSYFGLVGVQFVINISYILVPMLVLPFFIPNHIVAFVGAFTFIIAYYNMLQFHIMGYVIYQFHEELGVQPEVEYEPPSSGNKSEPSGLGPVAKAKLLVQEGHPEIARPFILQHLTDEMTAEQIQLHEIYIKLLKQQGEHAEMLRIGGDYILNLMEQGHGKKALQIFRLCHEVDPKFRLDHAEHTHTLVQAAHKASDYELMLALANSFAKYHPDYANMFELYLAVAKVLHEHFKQDKQAATILKSLISKFPQHTSIQQAKMTLARIMRAEQAAQTNDA